MNINELSENEKSVMLAKLCGLDVTYPMIDGGMRIACYINQGVFKIEYTLYEPHYLYDPVNMALAWRVLNWARLQKDNPQLWHEMQKFDAGIDMQPDVAVRHWLDSVLGLAIEAGMVE